MMHEPLLKSPGLCYIINWLKSSERILKEKKTLATLLKAVTSQEQTQLNAEERKKKRKKGRNERNGDWLLQ
jgi:hypothetical protein